MTHTTRHTLLRDARALTTLLLAALALLALVAAQPLRMLVDVGKEDGPGSDLPFVNRIYPPETDVQGTFRWTRDRSLLRLPGVGQRPLALMLTLFPINDEVAARGPQTIELWRDEILLAAIPVRRSGQVVRVLVPATDDGDQPLEIRSAVFVPTGDERAIGTPLATLQLAAAGGPVLPPLRSSALWLAAFAVLYIALRRCGFAPTFAGVLLGPVVAGGALAALADPVRHGFGGAPALVAASIGLLLVLGLRPACRTIARRFDLPLPETALRWLLLGCFAVFVLRYGGKIYADSMPGDIGFHANRFLDVMRGRVLLLSRNRGVDFPYPSALYLIVAPLTLAGLDARNALRLLGALLDACALPLVYAIGARLTPPSPPVGEGPGGRGEGAPLGLIAALFYGLSPAGFMTTWWNFSTHIFAQFTHTLLICAAVIAWPRAGRPLRPGWQAGVVFVLLFSLVNLGHFGFWINTTLLTGIVALVWAVAAWRDTARRAQLWWLVATAAAAQMVAAGLFYSAYTALFLEQLGATASGGLTGLAGREPAARAVLWRTLVDAGFHQHFGLFPLPAALAGLWLLRRSPVLPLLLGTLAVASVFMMLPFISGSTLSTRWLMFSAWVIAVGAAAAALALRRRGRAARIVVWCIGGYVLLLTLSMWLAALAWRVRPPEPF